MSMPSSPATPVKKFQEKKPKQQQEQQQQPEFNKPNEVTTPSALPKPVTNNKSVVTGSTSTKSTKSMNSPKTSIKATTIIQKEEKKKEVLLEVASPRSTSTSSPVINGKTNKSTSLSTRLPFFASTRAKTPRKPIIETEVLDFGEIYGFSSAATGSSTPKSSKNKHKVIVEKQTKADTKTTKEKEKEPKEVLTSPQQPQEKKKQENVVTVDTFIKTDTNNNDDDDEKKKSSSKANEVINQEASAILASMLHLQDPPQEETKQQQQEETTPKEEEIVMAEITDTEKSMKSPSSSSTSSQTSFKIPANLIPPKARSVAKSNGSSKTSSPKTSPPTPKEKKEKVHHSPKEKKIAPKNNKSPTLTPKEKPTSSSSVKEKSNVVKEKTSFSPKEIIASPQQKQQSVKEKASTVVLPTVEKTQEELKDVDDGTMPIIKTVGNGARCPVVTIEQMRKVEEICVSETGPNEEMMIENAGHGTSVMALKAIGGHRRIQPANHNAAPVVVVLAGNTKAGSYGLAAARHLANRGCHVYVMLAFRKEAKLSEGVTMQRKCAEFAGAHIVDNIEDLPQQQKTPVDLIIDGLMGSEFSVSSLRGDYTTRELLWDSMDWANSNKAPVLSLDFPSGINASDGLPFHVMHHIQPKWTLCFGAPKQGCTSRAITGELFLADIGIPSVSWRRIGISRCKIPWGAEFVIALEYDS
ncbi:YjeF N-terminal domain-containing protein [Circinella umbellata]|nr:YjeF N-terminal domain-containing protein [Circinella umbellata]